MDVEEKDHVRTQAPDDRSDSAVPSRVRSFRAFAAKNLSPSRIRNAATALRELTWDNPVLVKEFRTRMRGARAYWVLLIYVLLLTLVVGSTYLTWYTQNSELGMTQRAASETGRILYYILFSLQAGLVALITPAITAGAITIEREQQTFQMLATCRLQPRHIIWGKLLAAVAFVALLLTSSLPLVSLSFLLGGVSPGEVFGTYVSLSLSAFVFGSIGILCSAALRATAAATVATYAAVILLFFVTLGYGAIPGADTPFRSVNAATAIYHAVDMEPFFRTRLPSWMIGVTLNLLMGLLFANLAMTKLEHFGDRRAVAVRGLSTALWTAFLLFLTGNLLGQAATTWGASTSQPREAAVALLGFSFGLLALVLPIFTTGEWPPESGVPATNRVRDQDGQDTSSVMRDASGTGFHGSHITNHALPFHPVHPVRPCYNTGTSERLAYLKGMLPHKMFRAELPSGAPLMALWWLIACGLVLGGFAIVGKFAQFPTEAAPLLALALGVAAAFTALGSYLSVTFRDRRAAMVLAYLTIAALCLLPFIGYLTWEASGRIDTPRPSWQFLYLTPFLSFVEVGVGSSSFWTSGPPMLFGRTPFWLVTLSLYAVLAALLFSLTLIRLRKT
jgi:ABC-type transport system involved in multi-copper enzyme maturation permease subunit